MTTVVRTADPPLSARVGSRIVAAEVTLERANE